MFVLHDHASGEFTPLTEEEALDALEGFRKNPSKEHRYAKAERPKHFSPRLLMASAKRNPSYKIPMGLRQSMFWSKSYAWYEVLYVPEYILADITLEQAIKDRKVFITHVPAQDQVKANNIANLKNLGHIIDVRKI